ncbi:diguanylate cyclase [Geomesophilobacter sediminis]|uniref:diguanylate cyclase n=1 Tax=Geomesophilobacter sediminis TaxID=2798584 RepID=A0A8J7J9C0_9BACT|nr:GGDEF domain-containing protein [Geomesophilobacter sediminis]MBJ6726446.1 GGDEF domain-containing protein [Geomesophilobacter sediminis]
MPKKAMTEDVALKRAAKVLKEPAAVDLAGEYAALAENYRKLLRRFNKTLTISDAFETQHQEMARKLEEATRKYRQLKDVALPICMYCKKVRSDDDYWHRLETFFSSHVDIMFSHGICPDCVKDAYRNMGVNDRTGNFLAQEREKRAEGPREPVEDEALKEMRALVRQRAFEGNPMAPEVENFVERYGKMLRRFSKTVSISDSYQSQLMELKSRLELIARIDLLTGLANRWELVSRLESEKSRSERRGQSFTVMLADIDHFKKVNDTYGHQAGDRVIRGIADTLRGNLRGEDICGRWGGEEFLLILPQTGLPEAKRVAEKLIKKVRGTRTLWEDEPLMVTMSIGYGVFTAGMTVDGLISAVDRALYEAKRAGRNRHAAAG